MSKVQTQILVRGGPNSSKTLFAGKPAAASAEKSEDAKGGLWFWLGQSGNEYSTRKHRVAIVGMLRFLIGSEIPFLYHFMSCYAKYCTNIFPPPNLRSWLGVHPPIQNTTHRKARQEGPICQRRTFALAWRAQKCFQKPILPWRVSTSHTLVEILWFLLTVLLHMLTKPVHIQVREPC